ncbi:hypothetical protein [Mucilaginibacter antarcticus]|uniref:Uncharacterized protein n=1 Tax=Mucilaginibacter antarcticus TaxID=1855725 RepID=A0ABW5XSQ9_9SPHI
MISKLFTRNMMLIGMGGAFGYYLDHQVKFIIFRGNLTLYNETTAAEKLWLKDYLYQIMEYRETYEEVYDHMVLAVAEAPEEKHFESVVAGIN